MTTNEMNDWRSLAGLVGGTCIMEENACLWRGASVLIGIDSLSDEINPHITQQTPFTNRPTPFPNQTPPSQPS